MKQAQGDMVEAIFLLRAFRTTLRLFEFILRNIIAFLSWLGSIAVAILSRGARRAAFSAR